MGEYDDMFIDQDAHTPRGVSRLKMENERLRARVAELEGALSEMLIVHENLDPECHPNGHFRALVNARAALEKKP